MLLNNRVFWKKLFLFCLGLFIASAFCMKWMERDLVYNGKLFTIVGLEASYSLAEVQAILAGINETVRTILGYHLYFDFVFMIGVYPGIAAACILAAQKLKGGFRKVLLLLAVLQLVAWACDIAENGYLLCWLKDPARVSSFQTYHLVVYIKWALALGAVLAAIAGTLAGWRKKTTA